MPASQLKMVGWDTNKALEEATELGLTNERLTQFFLAQIQQRKR